MPVVVEEAEYYALAESKPKFVGDIPRTMPQIPPSPVNHAPTGSGGGVAPPFHETGAFKIGFLVACFGTILIWWRNRVG